MPWLTRRRLSWKGQDEGGKPSSWRDSFERKSARGRPALGRREAPFLYAMDLPQARRKSLWQTGRLLQLLQFHCHLIRGLPFRR